jgi:hypothetical protein
MSSSIDNARGKIVVSTKESHLLPSRSREILNISHPFDKNNYLTRATRHSQHNNLLLYNNSDCIAACINNRSPINIAYGAHTATHTTPQCLTQQCPRQASRPSSSAVPESHSTLSHLRPRICPKHSSQSRTGPWSGILWTGVIAWVSLVCLVLEHCVHDLLQREANSD